MKKVAVNGINVSVEKDEYEKFCEMFKENVQIDDLNDWEIKGAKIYDWKTFVEKSRDYLSEEPPDLIQCGEKLWGAAVYSLRKFYSQLGIDLASHDANTFAVNVLMNFSGEAIKGTLNAGWRAAQAGHNGFYNVVLDVYDYNDIINDVNSFCLAIDSLDPKNFKKIIDEIVDYKINSSSLSESIQKVISNSQLSKRLEKLNVRLIKLKGNVLYRFY